MSDLPSLANSSTSLDVPTSTYTKANVPESTNLTLTSTKRPHPEPTTTTTANASATASRAKRYKTNVKHRNGKGPSRRMATAAAASSARPSVGLELTNVSSDLCAACGAAGLYVCCDGCPRVFHPFCLEPPLAGVEEAGEHWYCRECDASQDRHPPIPSTSTGIFSALIQQKNSENPKVFKLPEVLRNRYENVATNPYTGDFVDPSRIKTKKKVDGVKGYVEDPHPYQLKTRDGKTILCYACGLGASAAKRLKILGCDECDQYFHLDCLDPPLVAPPPSTVKWMCPLHSEKAAPSRRFLKQSVTVNVTEPYTPNDGDIDVIVSSQRRIKAKNVEELVINRVRYQVPENIIILDFWSKIGGSDHASTTETPRLPVLGQDILPTSAATSEDASTLPSKLNDVVLGQHRLGCSISGDASQPSSRSSSPEPHISPQPNLSCLLQAASTVANIDNKDSGPSLTRDTPSNQSSSQIADKSLQSRRRARISTPRVGTRGSSRLANASAVDCTPASSTLNQDSTAHATKSDADIAPRIAPSLTVSHVDQSKGSSRPDATHSPATSGTPIPILGVTRYPRGFPIIIPQTTYPPSKDNINIAGSESSQPAVESPKSPKPSQHPSDQDTADADTDDSLFSKAPTRIRIKGTKYLDQPVRSPSSQQVISPLRTSDLSPRYASDRGISDSMTLATRCKPTQQGSSAGRRRLSNDTISDPMSLINRHKPTQQDSSAARSTPSKDSIFDPMMALKNHQPTPQSSSAGRSKLSKDTTPRPPTVKRPSNATATNSKTLARPSVMISSELRPGSPIVPVKRKQQKAPVVNTESAITTVEMLSGVSTNTKSLQATLPGTSPLTHDTSPHKASSINGTTRPRKKARRDDYPVEPAAKTSYPKRVDDNPPKLSSTQDNPGMSAAVRPDEISEPELTNPQPSTSKLIEVSLIHLPPLTNSSTLPKKANRPANVKKRIVSAPLSSADRPIEGSQMPKMILKLPARSTVPTSDKTTNALPVNSAVQLSTSAGPHGKSVSEAASGSTSQRAPLPGGSLTSSLSRPDAMTSSLDGVKSLARSHLSSSKTKTKRPSAASSPNSIEKLTARLQSRVQASIASHTPTLESVISRQNLPHAVGSGSSEPSARPALASTPVESPSSSSLPNRPTTKIKRLGASLSTIRHKPTRPKIDLSLGLPALASPLSHQIQPELSGSKTTTSKVTKPKVRKRVTSATGPSNSQDLTNDDTSLASVALLQTPNPLPAPQATTSLATQTSLLPKQDQSTPAVPVRMKKFKVKVPRNNCPSDPAQSTAITSTSTKEVPKTTASQSTLTIIAHPQNRLPFVPHPQHPISLPANFVPHPQYPAAFVAHPQHTPIPSMPPDEFVGHPQYPLKIFKNITRSPIGSGSTPKHDHHEPEASSGGNAIDSSDLPNGHHQLEPSSTS